jgi:opacity protein-like surface antigen
MKRLTLLLVGFAALASAAFALDVSVGAGFDFSDAITSIKNTELNQDDTKTDSVVNGFGGFLFFDAAYAEFDVSVSGQSGNFPLGEGYNSTYGRPASTTSVGFALLGKYPVKVGSFTVFPLLGLDYKLVIAAKSTYGDDIKDGNMGTEARGARGVVYANGTGHWENGALSDFSNLWIKFGVGGDFALNASWSVRCEYLYGVQLMNTAKTKSYEFYTPARKTEAGVTSGMTFKAAIVYRIGGTKSEEKK